MEAAGIDEDEWDFGSATIDNDIDRSEEPAPSEGDLKSCDNTTTIVVFESSHSGDIRDTLIEARNEIERRWRRIFTDLPRQNISTDSELGLQCLNLALEYIFTGMWVSWENLVSKCEEHVSVLEEHIYENPADETRAPELWNNSSLWLKIEKLLSLQSSANGGFRTSLTELSLDPDRVFLKDAPAQVQRLQSLMDEELSKPTTALTDLVYKSVEIRDSRHSIQLNNSLWRLSYVSFIFLPANFVSSFFGMNVDIFQPSGGYPHFWYYFIVTVPLLLLVLFGVNIMRNIFDNATQDPLRRATYEQVYTRFSESRSDLWTRAGPRDYVHAKGLWGRVKWWLIKSWFAPTHTIAVHPANSWAPSAASLGVWGQAKTFIASLWLSRLQTTNPIDPYSETELGDGKGMQDGKRPNGDAKGGRNNSPSKHGRPVSPRGSPGSQGPSGVLVEEEEDTDSDDNQGGRGRATRIIPDSERNERRSRSESSAKRNKPTTSGAVKDNEGESSLTTSSLLVVPSMRVSGARNMSGIESDGAM